LSDKFFLFSATIEERFITVPQFFIGKYTMKKDLLLIISTFVLTIALAGCGNTPATPQTSAPTSTKIVTSVPPTASLTPDPCSPGEIEAEVQKVQKHMREFDDASTLASSTPREQLSGSISDLQRIRREAEDEAVPACLTNLKTYQVQHMNSVIETLLAFMRGVDQQSLEPGITLAKQQHDQYLLELARLLGLTVVPADAPSAPSETATPP
jgi:hypothetical protein